jgi:phosphonate transport system permease protein
VRAAAILGIVGAGGIGRILDQSMRLLYWREVGMIILLFLITVALIDTGSRWLRQRLIGRGS